MAGEVHFIAKFVLCSKYLWLSYSFLKVSIECSKPVVWGLCGWLLELMVLHWRQPWPQRTGYCLGNQFAKALPNLSFFKGKINIKRGAYHKGFSLTLTVIWQYLIMLLQCLTPTPVPHGREGTSDLSQSILIFFGGGTVVWSQDFMLARQAFSTTWASGPALPSIL
jgi:hypothetical protein